MPAPAMILVASHMRAGTHFLIDTLMSNIKGASFPLLRPSFPSLENLILPHDKEVYEGMRNHLSGSQDGVAIFKTHLLPSEIEAALETPDFLTGGERDLLDYIYNNAKTVYVSRECRDLLVSLYYFMKNGGGHTNGLEIRLQEATFSDFIRMPNRQIHAMRSYQPYDQNRISYWLHHVEEWSDRDNVLHVSYEDLSESHSQTTDRLLREMGFRGVASKPVQNVPLRRYHRKPGLARFLRRLDVFNMRRLVIKQKNTSVMARKGIIGDWKNHFTDQDLEFYQSVMCENTERLAALADAHEILEKLFTSAAERDGSDSQSTIAAKSD